MHQPALSPSHAWTQPWLQRKLLHFVSMCPCVCVPQGGLTTVALGIIKQNCTWLHKLCPASANDYDPPFFLLSFLLLFVVVTVSSAATVQLFITVDHGGGGGSILALYKRIAAVYHSCRTIRQSH